MVVPQMCGLMAAQLSCAAPKESEIGGLQQRSPVRSLLSQASSARGGFEFYLIRATEYRFRREGGSGIPVLARRRYLYFLSWIGARECRPRVSGGKKWTTGWSRPLGPFFRAYQAGKQKQPFFFPYKTEITNAREKLVAQQRRREGVYNRAAEASVTFSGRGGARKWSGWSPYRGPKRNGLCPAEHEGYRLAVPSKVNFPGCAGLSISRPIFI